MLTMHLLLAGVLAPTAFAQEAGDLRVTAANGPGGRIFVDGEDTGVDTPGTISGLSPGNHIVEIRGGCLKGQGQVELTRGATHEVALPLEAFGGFVEVTALPESAVVTLDNKRITVPNALDLDCGKHVIAASAEGYVAQKRELEVSAGGFYRVDIALIEEGFGSVALVVDPDKARVYIDGDQVIVGSGTVNQVPSGDHTLRGELEGFAPFEGTVEVRAGETASATVTLERLPTVGPDLPLPPPDPARFRRMAGGGTALVGAGMAAFGGFMLMRATQVYNNDYLPAYNAADYDLAQSIFDAEIRPAKARGWSTLGIGGALLLGGGALMLVDDDGFMVGYTGRF